MRLLGAVLAGGRSTRFGSDKALALLDGKPLVQHAIDALSAQTEAVIVCGMAWGDWVADRPGPDLGPLGGIDAALHAAHERGFDAALTCPCDLPELPHDLAARLAGSGFVETMPVIGCWPAVLASRLDAHLAAGGDRSVRRWALSVGVAPVTLDAVLPNLNTADALAEFMASRR